MRRSSARRRFCEVAGFFRYAVVDGIRRLLFGARSGVSPLARTAGSAPFTFVLAKPSPRAAMGELRVETVDV